MAEVHVRGVLVLLVLTLGALPACQQGGASPAPGPAAGPGPLPPGTAAGVLPEEDRLRLHRVDMLVAQWDAAQAAGRAEQADALFRQVRQEVDAAFDLFVSASRGDLGVELQYLGTGALGFSSRPEATGVLVDRLASNDARLVANALIGVKLREDPETPLAPLLRLVTASAPEPRRFAPLAVAHVVEARHRSGRGVDPAMEREAAQVLSGVVADRDPFVRLHVARALGALRTPGVYELLEILMKDEHVRIRVAAAASLERLGDPRGFPSVILLLDGAPEDLKTVIADILASYAANLQGAALSAAERERLATSPRAWSSWFNAFRARGSVPGEATPSPRETPPAVEPPPAVAAPFPEPSRPAPQPAPALPPVVVPPPAETPPAPAEPPGRRELPPPVVR